MMETAQLLPKSPEEVKFQEKVKNIKDKLPDILVSPFNYDNWSQI
jgi:hypothetical protein